MTTVLTRKHVFPLLLIILLAGCSSGSDLGELRQFVEQTVNRPPGPIEPLPQFVSYQAFTYSAASLRSPFDIPAQIVSSLQRAETELVKPDETRPKEVLEGYALGNLKMVGSLSRGDTVWALIEDEQGVVHRITVGNHMGKNYGRVVATSETQVDLVEIVPSGDGGWIERPQTITLGSQNTGGAQ